MAPILAMVLVCAAASDAPLPAAEAAFPSASAMSPVRPRPLRETIRASLQRWARPTDGEIEIAARELLALYNSLDQDSQLSDSQREKYRVQLRHRLLKAAERIAYLEAVKRRVEEPGRPASVEIPEGKAEPLAQRQGAAMGLAPMGGQGGRGGTIPDAGEQLVDLIQRTVAPGSWDVQGGPGSIYYWRPGRALSVRHTGEVHEQVGGLLDQLRRAGQ